MAYRPSRRAGTGHNFFRRRGQSAQRQQRANVLQGTNVTFNLGGNVTGSQEMIGGNIFIPSSSIVAKASINDAPPFLTLLVSDPDKTIPDSMNSRNSYELLAFLFSANTFITQGRKHNGLIRPRDVGSKYL